MVVPLYISEISPPEIRGSLLVFEEFSIVFGIILSFWITYGTQYIKSEWSWQLPFLIQIIPGLILGAGAFLLPFSPRWLASKGKCDEALISIAKLRQLPVSDRRVRQEWIDIIAETTFQKEIMAERHPKLTAKTKMNRLKLELVSWADCFKPGCWRRTHIGAGLMFFQQVCCQILFQGTCCSSDVCDQFVGINALIYYSPTLFGSVLDTPTLY